MAKFECKRDGLTIRGKIYGDIRKKSPVYICSHGFLANMKMCKTYAKTIAKAGNIAIIYDFCGGGIKTKSDGKNEEMSVLTEMQDLEAVIAYVKQQPYTENISLLGCSQGGFVSAMVTKKYSSEINKLIMFYPALCIPDDARKGTFIIYKFDPNNIPDLIGKFPMKLGGCYAKAVINMDVFEEIGGYDGPVLLFHGDSDKIVPVDYSRKAKDLYKNCQYHELPGADHGFRGADDKKACSILTEFISK